MHPDELCSLFTRDYRLLWRLAYAHFRRSGFDTPTSEGFAADAIGRLWHWAVRSYDPCRGSLAAVLRAKHFYLREVLRESRRGAVPTIDGYDEARRIGVADPFDGALEARSIELRREEDATRRLRDEFSGLLPLLLSESDHQVLHWRYWDDLEYSEIALRREVSEATARQQVSRAAHRFGKGLRETRRGPEHRSP